MSDVVRSEGVLSVIKTWESACQKNSGQSDRWTERETSYRFEISNRKYEDGGATGAVFSIAADGTEKQCNSIKISGTGIVERAPKFLKAALNQTATATA